ncbi:MAG: hypothetical protein NXI31_09555 [bacterium]|nr:hypothetical protein [bacterium]
MSRYILASTVLALASSALAQNPMALLGQGYTPQTGGVPLEGPFVRPRPTPFPDIPSNGPLQNGNFTAVAAARFTGHVIPDVVFLSSKRAFYGTAPGLHAHAAPLPGVSTTDDVRDLAVLIGHGDLTGSNPAHDAVVLGGENGLQIWRFDFDIGSWNLEQVGGPEWNGVERIDTHPADPDVIYGVDDLGVVRFAEFDPVSGEFENAGSFTVSGTPIDLACIDWNGDGQSDVAVLTSTGLTVRDRANTQLGHINDPNGSGSITRVRNTVGVGDTGVYEDRVAWLIPNPGGNPDLLTYGPATVAVIPLPEPFVAVGAGDWSNDHDEDIVLATGTNNDVSVLLNLADGLPAAPFVVSVTTGVRVAVAAADPFRPDAKCTPVIADFDADGDSDLWMPIEPDDTQPWRILVTDKTINVPTPQPITSMRYDEVTGLGRIVFDHLGGSQTHSQVTIWRRELTGELNPVPVEHVFVEYLGQLGADVPVYLDPVHFAAGGTFYIMIRPVVRVNGHTIQTTQASLFGADNTEGETGGIENNGPPPTDPPFEPPAGDPPPQPGD